MKIRKWVIKCDFENMSTNSPLGFILQKDGSFAPDLDDAKKFLFKFMAKLTAKRKRYGKCSIIKTH